MKIGVPKEIKNHEYRVAITPDGVKQLVAAGHSVSVEHDAGSKIGYADNAYQSAGAEIAQSADELYQTCELIVKVKEPQAGETAMLSQNHTLFAYLHLAPDEELTDALLTSGAIGIAYETVSEDGRYLPLLAPMSEVAGKLAVQTGAHYLQTAMGGRGVLLGGVEGVAPANVLVLGGGVVGGGAVKVAVGMGANVTLVDQVDSVLARHKASYPNLNVVNSREQSINSLVSEADLIIGAVLVAGGSAPKVVSEAMVQNMKPGSVIVDVAIDQGGCIATSRVTSHDEPVFTQHGVIHYCVGNMPSAAAWTSTQALTNATLPYVLELANKGIDCALRESAALRRGLNVYKGALTFQAVADAQNKSCISAEELLG